MINMSANEKFGAAALEKQLARYMDAAGCLCAFVFPTLFRRQRDVLIERGIPFVCLPDQVYLPFLGVFLSEQFRKQKTLSQLWQ